MIKIWDEAAIREELARLDEITGLNGAKLPIKFTNGAHVIGCYHGDKGGSFSFSRKYFQNPEWAVEEALDTIRHEYAHYMDHLVYGGVGHGESWKICCVKVGACPVRNYVSWKNDYYNKKREEKEQKITEMLDYKIGDRIIHPKYGEGLIKAITGTEIMQNVQVVFDLVGQKTLSLAWVNDNCNKK